MLFARLRSDDRAFWFLGPATYVKHESEHADGDHWRLEHPLPGDLSRSSQPLSPEASGPTPLSRAVAAEVPRIAFDVYSTPFGVQNPFRSAKGRRRHLNRSDTTTRDSPRARSAICSRLCATQKATG